MTVTNVEHHMALCAITNGKAPAVLTDELFVGRTAELSVFDRDLEIVEAGGAALRILVGEPGAGKTMLQHVIAKRARERGFVTASADLEPDCLLHGRGGEGRALLAKTMLSMRTSGAGDEPALNSIVSRFANDCRSSAEAAGQLPRDYMRAQLANLQQHAKSADFAKVIQSLAMARDSSSVAANAQRWLSGDYSSIADAREGLGITSIVDDPDFWLMQKLWSTFVRSAGRSGYVLMLDEARILCDLYNPNARALNLEQLLTILNDILQGRASGILVVIAATPSFVTQWNGIRKHDGLSSCLLHQTEQLDIRAGMGNVLVHLQDLKDEEMGELLRRCRALYSACHPQVPSLPDEAIDVFAETCRNQIGEAHWHVPRIVLQRFIAFLERTATHTNLTWRELVAAPETGSNQTEFEDYADRQM